MAPLLDIRRLTVEYRQHGGPWVPAVKQIDFKLEQGETVGLVGESGCGKSTLALAVMGLLPSRESRIPEGEIFFQGKNLLAATPEEWQALRGRRIAIVFQDPFSSLNPVLTMKEQLTETLVLDGH